MVVKDDLDCRVDGVGRGEELEELDEFAAAVAFLDQDMDVAGEQVDACHQCQRAVPLILVIAHHSRAGAGKGGRSGAVVAIAWIPGFSS